ncbi:MAG: thiamine biosynthesis protein ThiS [Spirochaetaceae bacterium]|nr:thiamine biosynthesis protein ThiS [Spirochaetaceae bacterium]|tara:strand:- start:1744 stop:1935 length:192 start_codon:yes stop_codon:yes gene_type:complete
MIVNGENRSVEVSSLLEFIQSLGLDPGTVAVERNGEIVRRESWDSTALSDEDKLEIIRFVGGG